MSARRRNSFDKLTVLTWNIWFEELQYERRMRSIRKTIMELKADVVCLQEVLLDFENILRDDKTLNSYYVISSFENVRSSYGIISLCRKDLAPAFNFFDFPSSRMNRCLLLTSFKVNGSFFAIGNVHLESLSYHSERERQLKICFDHLQNFHSALLVGDFNFCSERNYDPCTYPLQNLSLSTYLPGFIDVWPHLRQHQQSDRSDSDACVCPFSTPPRHANGNVNSDGSADSLMGYTFDSVKNSLIGRSAPAEERMRYDRVMLRSEGGRGRAAWVPHAIDLVGTTPLDALERKYRGRSVKGLFASDHFGIICQLSTDLTDISSSCSTSTTTPLFECGSNSNTNVVVDDLKADTTSEPSSSSASLPPSNMRSVSEYISMLQLDDDEDTRDDILQELRHGHGVWRSVVGSGVMEASVGADAARENGIFDRLIRALGATYCEEDHAPILRSLLTDGVTLRGDVFVDWYVRWILGEGEEQGR